MIKADSKKPFLSPVAMLLLLTGLTFFLLALPARAEMEPVTWLILPVKDLSGEAPAGLEAAVTNALLQKLGARPGWKTLLHSPKAEVVQTAVKDGLIGESQAAGGIDLASLRALGLVWQANTVLSGLLVRQEDSLLLVLNAAGTIGREMAGPQRQINLPPRQAVLREGTSSQELAEVLTQGVPEALAPLLAEHPGLWAISPEFAPAWEEDGDKALAAEDSAKARLDFLAAVSADNSSPIYHHKLAQAWLLAEQPEKARQEMEIARQLDPKSLETLLALGEVYLQLGNPGRASGYFESAGLLNEQDPRPKVGLAKANLRRGNIAPALKIYEALLTRYPKDAAIHRAYGDALVEAKQPRKAIGEFRRALELGPKDRSTRQALTRVLLGEGYLPEGIEQLRLLSQDSSSLITLSPADYGRTLRYWTAELDAVLRGLDPLLAKYRQGGLTPSQLSGELQNLHSRSDNLARLAEKITPPQELDRSHRYWVLAANLTNQSDFEALRYAQGQGEEVLRRAQLFRQAAVAAAQEARDYAGSASR